MDIFDPYWGAKQRSKRILRLGRIGPCWQHCGSKTNKNSVQSIISKLVTIEHWIRCQKAPQLKTNRWWNWSEIITKTLYFEFYIYICWLLVDWFLIGLSWFTVFSFFIFKRAEHGVWNELWKKVQVFQHVSELFRCLFATLLQLRSVRASKQASNVCATSDA